MEPLSYFGGVKWCRHLLVVWLAAQLTGLTWLGLQAVSKARQTCRNVREAGVVTAIKRLPKGKGNCAMCKKIRLARAQQAQQRTIANAQPGWPSLSPAVLSEPVAACPCLQRQEVPAHCAAGFPSRSEPPPTPPPRRHSLA